MKKYSFFQAWQAFLFPDFCQHCQKMGPMLCESCYQLVEFFWQENLSHLFTKNFQEVGFDQLRIMARFQLPFSSLIKSLKYQHHGRAAKFLAQMLYFHVNIDYQKIDCISFIPIHQQKIKKRGYNQSQLIAEELSLWTKKPCLNLLYKSKNTQAQAEIKDKNIRLSRLEHNFAIMPSYQNKLNKKHILLIDDVLTTGATINSASLVLKANQAHLVTALATASKL